MRCVYPHPSLPPRPAVDDGGSEPPLKRARSSSVGGDNNSIDGSGLDNCREESQGDWGRSGDDSRESRDAALNAELARYMIRTEPLGTDRHHNRYWYMHVSGGLSGVVVAGLGAPGRVVRVLGASVLGASVWWAACDIGGDCLRAAVLMRRVSRPVVGLQGQQASSRTSLCCAALCCTLFTDTIARFPLVCRWCLPACSTRAHIVRLSSFFFNVLQSFPTAMFVESAEGDSLGVITTKAQLDTLMHSLNRRGPREMLLHAVRGLPACALACLLLRLLMGLTVCSQGRAA